jgi:hypothetical protein
MTDIMVPSFGFSIAVLISLPALSSACASATTEMVGPSATPELTSASLNLLKK